MDQSNLLKFAVEAQSGGKNTVLMDAAGLPSIMVRVPKLRNCDLFDGGSDEVHPAFIVNGQEKDCIYISKYQNVVIDGRPYSQPFKDPTGFHNFDEAAAACARKGRGWHLMTNAEYALIALWCKRNGFFPHGNNDYGADYRNPHERGVVTYSHKEDGAVRPAHVATGSGPATWAHDGTPDGIYDLNGNMWEWCAGYRIMNGEVQVIPYNDAACNADQSPESKQWRAIRADGSLVQPGFFDDTIKVDCLDETQTDIDPGEFVFSTTIRHPQRVPDNILPQAAYYCSPGPSLGCEFGRLKARGLEMPEVTKALAIFPADADGYDGDIVYTRNFEERLPLRGGRWKFGSRAGVFATDFCDQRIHSSSFVAIRSCYVDV